jgi:hypothetical protein
MHRQVEKRGLTGRRQWLAPPVVFTAGPRSGIFQEHPMTTTIRNEPIAFDAVDETKLKDIDGGIANDGGCCPPVIKFPWPIKFPLPPLKPVIKF